LSLTTNYAGQTLLASSLDFGILHSEHEMMLMKSINALTDTEVKLLLDLIKRELVIVFPLVLPSNPHQRSSDHKLFKVRISLDKLKQIYVEKIGTVHQSLVIPLDCPPEVYLQTRDIKSTHDDGERSWREWQTWFRQTDVVEDREQSGGEPTRFRKEKSIIDIGRTWPCVYRILALLMNH
jgi:RNA-dependent RNA polymerase